MREKLSNSDSTKYTIDFQGLIDVLADDPVAIFFDEDSEKMNESAFGEKYLGENHQEGISFIVEVVDGKIPHLIIRVMRFKNGQDETEITHFSDEKPEFDIKSLVNKMERRTKKVIGGIQKYDERKKLVRKSVTGILNPNSGESR